jgi:hypothetical protein
MLGVSCGDHGCDHLSVGPDQPVIRTLITGDQGCDHHLLLAAHPLTRRARASVIAVGAHWARAGARRTCRGLALGAVGVRTARALPGAAAAAARVIGVAAHHGPDTRSAVAGQRVRASGGGARETSRVAATSFRRGVPAGDRPVRRRIARLAAIAMRRPTVTGSPGGASRSARCREQRGGDHRYPPHRSQNTIFSQELPPTADDAT